jgi:TPR repeat protein
MLKKTAKLLCTAIATCWVAMAFAAEIDAEAEMQAGLDAWQAGDMIGALKHYHVAAEAGIAPAQAKLGYIYDQSNDDEKAVQWYRQAAEQQDPDGEFGLGEMYSKGEGVEKDYEVAVEMYMRAAVGGHAQARRVLANAYEHGALGRKASADEALRWLTLAANSGDIRAMQRMASLYTDGGLGVKPDPAQAKQWQARVDAAQAE